MSTENDKAWGRYLLAKNIVFDQPTYLVRADELKNLSGREPRLLAKFDTPDQLARPLRDAGYTILPIKNGLYQLVRGNLFFALPTCIRQSNFTPKLSFPLLTAGRSSGEAQFIDNAFNTGLLANFLGITEMYQTIRGREYTTHFDFQFSGSVISVESVQIEVDAGYEALQDIVLIEAKIGAPTQFNIRQLYYPYRHFSALVPQKRVRNIFLTYDIPSGSYMLHELMFPQLNNPLEVSVEQCTIYKIIPSGKLSIHDLLDARFQTRSATVPQANDLNKVFELLTLVEAGINRADGVADHFVFEKRQSSYYREAAEYLGLITTSQEEGYTLTEMGIAVLSEPVATQTIILAKVIINSWIFVELVRRAGSGRVFTIADIDTIIAGVKNAKGEAHYGGSTIKRRRQTITSWIEWLAREIGCFSIVEDGVFKLS